MQQGMLIYNYISDDYQNREDEKSYSEFQHENIFLQKRFSVMVD